MTSRNDLRGIARRAMIQRARPAAGLSPAVLPETNAITEAVSETDPSVRDLRGLLWASIRVELVHTDVERGFIDFVRQLRG